MGRQAEEDPTGAGNRNSRPLSDFGGGAGTASSDLLKTRLQAGNPAGVPLTQPAEGLKSGVPRVTEFVKVAGVKFLFCFAAFCLRILKEFPLLGKCNNTDFHKTWS